MFFYYFSFPLNVPRDSEKRITSISLISLQNVLSVLLKLKIVTREEIDNVFKSTEFRGDSIPRKVWVSIFNILDSIRGIIHRRISLCLFFLLWNDTLYKKRPGTFFVN